MDRKIKWYQSLRSKFFIAFSVPVLVFGICVLVYSTSSLRTRALSTVQEKVETLSEVLAFSVSPAMIFQDQEVANETLNAAKLNPQIDFALVLSPNGNYFAGFGEEFIPLAQGVTRQGTQILEDQELLLFSTPVTHESEEIGTLILGHSLTESSEHIAQSRDYIIVIGILLLFIGIGFVFWLSTVFTRHLTNMVKVVRQIGVGDFSQRTSVSTADEIGILGKSINSMATQLESNTNEIKRREFQFRGLADNMNQGLVQLDQSNQILYVNPKFCELFEVDQAKVFGRLIDTVVAQAYQPEDFLVQLKLAEEGQFEIRMQSEDAQKTWLLVSYARVQIPGEEDQTIALFTDISKMKKAETELVYKNRELDTFVYKASHDLKAPLASLMGLIDLYKAGSGEEQQSLMPLIERTVAKMDGVLLGLLEVTWIKQGALNYEAFTLNSLIDTILQSIQFATGFESVKVTREFDPELTVVSDHKLLISVMQNLIQNAIKYHRETGENRIVRIRAMQDEHRNVICVEDNGPGIHPDAVPKLFDMFYRATNRSKGSGLGLYIVKTSLEKLGGSISLDTKLDQGTEFRLEFPVVEPSEPASDQKSLQVNF